MKKSVLLAVVGLAASVATSFGQGKIAFSSYTANGGAGATTTIFGGSTLVGSTYTAQLYYALGTVSDPVNFALATSVSSLVTGLQSVGTPITFATAGATAGYFIGANTQIPDYISGAITFEVVAYNGIDYASSSIRGRSGSFTMASIATGAAPYSKLTGMPDFKVATVAAVPEPSTLALAGLGGFGMLMAMRRKKA